MISSPTGRRSLLYAGLALKGVASVLMWLCRYEDKPSWEGCVRDGKPSFGTLFLSNAAYWALFYLALHWWWRNDPTETLRPMLERGALFAGFCCLELWWKLTRTKRRLENTQTQRM